MNLFLPKELIDHINDFIRPLPTLRTITNWREGSIRFDINELKCAYGIGYNQYTYIRRDNLCNIHNYNNMITNPYTACNCIDYHIIRPYFKPNLIWKDNYIALWKHTTTGYLLIWHYVDIIQCDYCGDSHMLYHTNKIDDRYICNWCHPLYKK